MSIRDSQSGRPPAAGFFAGFGIPLLALCPALMTGPGVRAVTLEEMYDRAGPAEGYDKYIVLETGVTYTGGLWIGGSFNRITAEFEPGGADVRIVGNGAILDLDGRELCLAYCNNRLDIDDCIVINGDVKFRGYRDSEHQLVPRGSVRYVTFYQPHDYGVRLFGCGGGVLIERNIIVDAIDTGPDFMYLTGIPSVWLPTGASFSVSLQQPFELYDNWSYHGDEDANADPLRHFCVLCDYG
ncbi:MAG: hypothetical protein SYC29_07430 [Planctomycetota bacterium]|nr:hypothetical protein [Planctomycetota bacterium]